MKRSAKQLFICAFFLTNVFIFATTVSICLVQNESAPSSALKMSQIIEDQLFTNFFNDGYIVSNMPMRFDGENFRNSNFGVKDAAFGMSDVLFVFYIKYNPNEQSPAEKTVQYAQLDAISWRAVIIQNTSILHEDSLNKIALFVDDNDPYKELRNITDTVYKDIKILLRTNDILDLNKAIH